MADEPRDTLDWEEEALRDGADVGEVWGRRDIEERLLDTQNELVDAIDRYREELAGRLEYRTGIQPDPRAKDALQAKWREFLMATDTARARLERGPS